MKITTLSAVLCLAASTALADKKSTLKPIDNAVVKRADPGVQAMQGRPLAVVRHEQQGKQSKHHKEHHIEAHRDGKPKNRNKDNKKDEQNKDDQDEGEDNDEDEDDHHEQDSDEQEKEEKEEKGREEEKEEGSKGKKTGGAGKQSSNGKKGDGELMEEKEQGTENGKGDDKKSGDNKNTSAKEPQNGSSVDSDAKKGGNSNTNNSNGATQGSAAPGSAAPGSVTPGSAAPGTTAPGSAAPGAATPGAIATDSTSPLWLVQPYGASVWEQGRAYVISWGPNPDPVYAKAIKPKTPVNIRLMQGPPESLREVAVLKAGVDSDLHSFQWTVPVSVTPAKDYSIRLTHEGDVDTYSHYFEVVKAGDPRSNKSNVGEPLQMPQKGDLPQHSTKGPLIKPAAPPNPIPADKPAASKPAAPAPPVAAKPAGHTSAAVESTHRNANMLGIALTLFGAVYLL